MSKTLRIVVIVLAGIVVLLIAAYAAMGAVIYDQLTDAEGSCDEHLANAPDHFVLHPDWPPFELSPYFMPDYEVVRYSPAGSVGSRLPGGGSPATPTRPW